MPAPLPRGRGFFSFDNSQFLGYLRSQGFYVASHSRANYPKTFQSLASSLNMTHLTHLTPALADSADQTPLYPLSLRHAVGRYLAPRGYRLIQVGSWWPPTHRDPFAHANYAYDPPVLDHCTRVLLHPTAICALLRRLAPYHERDTHRASALYQFDALAQAVEQPGPKLVFAHILLPHRPFVFDADGGPLTSKDEATRPVACYLAQLRFLNSRLRDLLDPILHARGAPPIVILQADEGPYCARSEFGVENGADVNWLTLSDDALRMHIGILNAYHFPGVDTGALYDSLTPVNTFRVLLDLYFGEDLPLLEDRSYIFPDLEHPYRFVDVTARLAGRD